jgi:hypothetical protein
MADRTIDGIGLPDFDVDTTTLSDAAEVQRIELVTAVEGGVSTNLAKAEDAAHASGDQGVMLLAVRNDTPTALAGTTLDYIPLSTDNLGRLHVVLSGASSMPGALSTTDSVSAVRVGDSIMWGGVSYTPTHFAIDRATAADGAAVVTLTASRKIVLVHYVFICASANTAKWVSSTSNSTGTGSNTDLCPFMSFAANSGPPAGPNEYGHIVTNVGESLKLQLSGATQVSGYGTYIKVP